MKAAGRIIRENKVVIHLNEDSRHSPSSEGSRRTNPYAPTEQFARLGHAIRDDRLRSGGGGGRHRTSYCMFSQTKPCDTAPVCAAPAPCAFHPSEGGESGPRYTVCSSTGWP